MNTSAIILMLSVWISVISLTVYFFAKILRKPKSVKPDVIDENEDSTDK